jgi:diamine N-acetyltransferase
MIVVRPATPSDYLTLSSLGRETFYETWKDYNTEEDMQIYLAASFNDEKIKADLENTEVNTFFLAFDNNKAIGYAKLRRDRTYEEFKGEKNIEVERVYVRKEYQSKKVGKELMNQCMKISREDGNVWIWLGVNVDNTKAIEFYKKYGFTIFGTKSFQLGNTVDPDYLMKCRL